jgi:hypothetical protein
VPHKAILSNQNNHTKMPPEGGFRDSVSRCSSLTAAESWRNMIARFFALIPLSSRVAFVIAMPRGVVRS